MTGSPRPVSITSQAIAAAEEMLDLTDIDIRNMRLIGDSLSAEQMDPDMAYAVASAEVNATIVSLWRQGGRQVLFIHPDLADIVGHVDGGVVTETLRALPYRNPFVCLAEPIQVAHDPESGTNGYLAGYFTFGRPTREPTGNLCDTHDPTIVQFSVLAIVQVRDAASGELIDGEFNRLSIPITSEPVDIADVARELTARGRYRAFNGSVTHSSEYIETIFRFVLASLSYLVSTTLDVEEIPRARTRRMRKLTIARGKPLAMTKVGWRLGPALVAARHEASRSAAPGTGPKRAPHAVRAHFRTVWTGKGRTVPKMTFIAPYLTGTGVLDDTTLHIVKPPRE